MFTRLFWLCSLLSIGLIACNGQDKDDEDSGGEGEGEGGDEGGESGGESGGDGGGDGQSPSILEADAWCYKHPKSDATYLWMANATVDDPQGLDTLESFFEGVSVSTNDVEVADYSMVCTDGGDCTTSWNQNEDGVACSNAGAYVITITVVDEDGNWSDPVEVTGRLGSDAEGR
jgi:hypothetical protein